MVKGTGLSGRERNEPTAIRAAIRGVQTRVCRLVGDEAACVGGHSF